MISRICSDDLTTLYGVHVWWINGRWCCVVYVTKINAACDTEWWICNERWPLKLNGWWNVLNNNKNLTKRTIYCRNHCSSEKGRRGEGWGDNINLMCILLCKGKQLQYQHSLGPKITTAIFTPICRSSLLSWKIYTHSQLVWYLLSLMQKSKGPRHLLVQMLQVDSSRQWLSRYGIVLVLTCMQKSYSVVYFSCLHQIKLQKTMSNSQYVPSNS